MRCRDRAESSPTHPDRSTHRSIDRPDPIDRSIDRSIPPHRSRPTSRSPPRADDIRHPTSTATARDATRHTTTRRETTRDDERLGRFHGSSPAERRPPVGDDGDGDGDDGDGRWRRRGRFVECVRARRGRVARRRGRETRGVGDGRAGGARTGENVWIRPAAFEESTGVFGRASAWGGWGIVRR